MSVSSEFYLPRSTLPAYFKWVGDLFCSWEKAVSALGEPSMFVCGSNITKGWQIILTIDGIDYQLMIDGKQRYDRVPARDTPDSYCLLVYATQAVSADAETIIKALKKLVGE